MAIKSLFLNRTAEFESGHSTTNIIVRESLNRFDTYIFTPEGLFLESGKIKAKVFRIHPDKKIHEKWYADKKPEIIELNRNNIIHCRLEPPFDMEYVATLHLLSLIEKDNLIANKPSDIINFPEKILATILQKFTPDTLISRDPEVIERFFRKNGACILKPVYNFSGEGVVLIKKDDKNFRKTIKDHLADNKEPVILQKFIPQVVKGDKRIILIDGKITGQVLKLPAKGELRANLVRGATIHKCKLSRKERKIAEEVAKFMKQKGIFMLSLDIIDEQLIESNITCPGGLAQLNQLYPMNSEKIYWDRLEQKIKRH